MQTNKKMNEYLDVSFRRIVENLDQAILVLGGDLVESPAVEYANPAFARWVGAHNDEIAGNSLAFLFAPEDREYLMQTLLMTIETGRDQVASLGFVGLDRHHRKIDFIVKPFHRKMGAPVSCMLIEKAQKDNADLAVSGDQSQDLWKAQQNDPETGVFNRRYLYEQIERECLRLQRYGSVYTLLSIELIPTSEEDTDRELGVIDAVFALVAGILQEAFRTQDIIGRNQPDQFIVLLPETKLTHAMDVAERIRHDVAKMNNHSLVGFDLAIGITEGKAVDAHFSGSLDRLEQAIEKARMTRGVAYYL